MPWRMRAAVVAILALLLALFPVGRPQQAAACPPDLGGLPGSAPYAAPPCPPTPPAFVADLASKNPRTFGRHIGHAYVGDPVDVVSGAYSFSTAVELRVPSHGLDFSFSRTYNSADDFAPSPMGPGWVHSYDWEYFEAPLDQPRTTGRLRRGDGRRGVQPDDLSFTYNGADNTYTLVTHDHSQYVFGGAYPFSEDRYSGSVTYGWVITSITGAAGDRMDLTWSALVPAGTAGAQTYGYAKVLLSLRDTQGRMYSFGYDARWDLSSVTDPFGRRLNFSHDTSDRLISATDLGGRTTAYAYENNYLGATRHITTVTDPNGWVRPTNTYANNGAVTSQIDSEGYLTTFSITPYASATVTDPRGTATTYTANSCGWLSKQTVTGGSTYIWRQSFNAACDRTQTVDPLGNTTDFAYDTAHNLLSRSDPLVAGGRPATAYQYDSRKNVTRIADPRGFTTDRTYDPLTSALLTERHQIDATTYATTAYTYGDALNKLRPTTITSPRGYATTTTYDANGNVTRIQDADGVATTFGYDAFGRRTTATDAEGHATATGYDAVSQVISAIDPRGNATRYAYDGIGNTLTVTDRNGNVTAYGYDRNSRLRTVQQHPDPSTTYTTTLLLDGNGNVTRVTEGNGNFRDLTYNGLDALSSITEYTSQGTLTTTYGRDGNGNKTSRTTPDGVTVSYGHDGMNRLTSVTAPNVSITYAYDLVGDVTSMVDATGTTTFSYDGAGRPMAANGPVNSLTYSFDLDGNRTRVGYPLGDVSDTYTAAGRLLTVRDWAARTSTYAYTPSGRVASLAYPNGMITTFSYNADGQLTQLVNAVGATTITSHAYGLDAEGNRTSLDEVVSGITAPGATDHFAYGYDGLNRLRTVTGPVAESFTYDGASNITTRAGPSATYSYDAADRVQSDGTRSVTWSTADRVIARGADTFAYDSLDRLTSAAVSGSTATYAYAGDGLLAARSGVAYLWDRSLSVQPLVGAGADSIIYGIGPLYVIHGDGRVIYLALDALGSVRVETNVNGGVDFAARYAAYGAIAQSVYAKSNPLGFAGELTDANGLIYLRARWYDPSTGRFQTHDLVPGDLTTPRTLNAYIYGAANPVLQRDPSGLCALICVVAIGAVIGGIVGGASYAIQQAASGEAIDGQALAGNILLGAALGASAALMPFSAVGFGSGAAIGAVVGGFSDLAIQVANGATRDTINIGELAGATIGGAVGGFVTGGALSGVNIAAAPAEVVFFSNLAGAQTGLGYELSGWALGVHKQTGD